MGIKQSRQILQNQHSNNSKVQHTGDTTTSHSTSSVIIDGRAYHNVEKSTYILPRDELEQDRLNSQHFSIKAMFAGNNILPSITDKLPPNSRVLDVGCGSGSWVMEMAIDYPEYDVIGLDMVDMFPTTIRPKNVRFDLLNVLNGLPYEDNSFDMIHMRLMIVALRANEWEQVLTEIRRVLKPGGLLQLVESDFTEKSSVPIVQQLNDAWHKSLLELGQDPWIAPKLDSILTQLKFTVIDEQARGLDYGDKSDPVARELFGNWKNALQSLKPLIQHQLVERPELYDDFVERYLQGCAQGGWYIKVVAICAQKPIEG